MSKLGAIKGVAKVLWSSLVEDFQQMDHKIVRIGVGIAVFIFWAFFWFYFFRNTSPFGFF
ncbi:MAG: hypothetical protein HYW25_05550 [Candidatus Aenigmarchaeota archaeon]|nr:hypothetical protein [Candidatus Aenigmarchaeota archaeon]